MNRRMAHYHPSLNDPCQHCDPEPSVWWPVALSTVVVGVAIAMLLAFLWVAGDAIVALL